MGVQGLVAEIDRAAEATGGGVVSLAGGYFGVELMADGARLVLAPDLNSDEGWVVWSEDQDGERLLRYGGRSDWPSGQPCNDKSLESVSVVVRCCPKTQVKRACQRPRTVPDGRGRAPVAHKVAHTDDVVGATRPVTWPSKAPVVTNHRDRVQAQQRQCRLGDARGISWRMPSPTVLALVAPPAAAFRRQDRTDLEPRRTAPCVVRPPCPVGVVLLVELDVSALPDGGCRLRPIAVVRLCGFGAKQGSEARHHMTVFVMPPCTAVGELEVLSGANRQIAHA